MMKLKAWITALIIVFSAVSAIAVAGEPQHVVIFGDSNSWLGGDDCSKPRGWNFWLREALQPESIHSYARSGATWTHTAKTKRNTQEYTEVLGDDNVVMNQIFRMEEAMDSGTQVKPDLILIMAGTNDAWFRPESLDDTQGQTPCSAHRGVSPRVSSLAEAVAYDCALLRERLPEARIVLLTPMRSRQAGKRNILRAGDIIVTCGEQLGIEVIRLDGEAVETADGTHTTVAGAKRIGEIIAQRLFLNDK